MQSHGICHNNIAASRTNDTDINIRNIENQTCKTKLRLVEHHPKLSTALISMHQRIMALDRKTIPASMITESACINS